MISPLPVTPLKPGSATRVLPGIETEIVDDEGNPAPLGLLGFGLKTVLLNIHNAGFYEINSMILAMGIAYGGIAQIIASYEGIFTGTSAIYFGLAEVLNEVYDKKSSISLGNFLNFYPF